MFTFLTETMLTGLRVFTLLQGLMHLDDGGECARDIHYETGKVTKKVVSTCS